MFRFSIGTAALIAAFAPLASAQHGLWSSLPAGNVYTSGGMNWGVPVARDHPLVQSGGGWKAPLRDFNNVPTSAYPVYDAEAMFGPTARWLVDIDAMSTGNSLIPVAPDGTVQMPSATEFPNFWSALHVSVRRGTIGPGANQHLQSMAGQSIGEGGEILGYYFPGSQIPAYYMTQPFLEHSAADVSVAQGALPGPAEISAIDSFMPFLETLGDDPFFPFANTFYFSLTDASAQLLVNVDSFAAIDSTAMNGATIFKITWVDGAWSDVDPVILPESIGLSSDDEVDALDVAQSTAEIPFRLLLSVTSNSLVEVLEDPSDPLSENLARGIFAVFVDSTGTATSDLLPLRNDSGDVVTRAAGLTDPGDVDGICTVDPKYDATIVYSAKVGVPTDFPAFTPGLMVSAGRCKADPQDPLAEGQDLVMRASWTPAQANDWGIVGWVLDTDPSTTVDDYVLHAELRAPGQTFADYRIASPALVGIDARIFGGITDLGLGQFSFSHPVVLEF